MTERSLRVGFDVGRAGVLTRVTPTADVAAPSVVRGMDLPFEDGAFSRVACAEGLQLLPDRRSALDEIHRVLRPGGVVEVSVEAPIERHPAIAALADHFDGLAEHGRAAAVRWLFCLSEPDDLRGALAEAGFDDITVEPDERRAIRGRARRGWS